MIIVTGGAGFIGSCIVRMLNDMKIEDIIIVDNIAKTDKWMNLRNKKYIEYINRDNFLLRLSDFNGKVSHIIHLGACSATTEKDFDFLYKNNFEYTKTLWQWCAQNNASFIYASSAESIDSELYDAYKDAALRMIAGDDTYFVCDITCELSLHPKLNGKAYRPLISQEIVDDAMRKNEFKANREYFNKFDLSGGQDALVKRTTILAHSLAYEPIFDNADKIFPSVPKVSLIRPPIVSSAPLKASKNPLNTSLASFQADVQRP